MFKEMSNDEFIKCATIDHGDMNRIVDEMESKGITKLIDQIEYIKINKNKQEYLYVLMNELDKVILNNYHEINETFVFSKNAVDGILRAFAFALQFIQEGLPQHAYNYIENKSSSFFSQLLEQYQNEKVI